MEHTIKQRVCKLANYIIDNQSTIRSTAQHFGVSKSTVHKDLQQRLPRYSQELYLEVRKILDFNKLERHIRGGNATREKYKKH